VGNQSVEDEVYDATNSQSFSITMDDEGRFDIEMNEDWI